MKNDALGVRYLSLGAGVQSSTLALMYEHRLVGDGSLPDFAVFADTGAEPAGVYSWLEWLERKLSYPVVRVMQDAGLTDHIENGVRWDGPPFFVRGEDGRASLGRRSCTKKFKIEPIERYVRNYVKEHGVKRATAAHGISLDEVYRMKDSGKRWLKFEYPLVDMRMTRQDCIRWMLANNYPEPPRSACVYCPYHSNDEWRNLKFNDYPSWAEAIRIDALIREKPPRGMKGDSYAHRQLVPLPDIDLRTEEDHGQLPLWLNECEGMCGV